MGARFTAPCCFGMHYPQGLALVSIGLPTVANRRWLLLCFFSWKRGILVRGSMGLNVPKIEELLLPIHWQSCLFEWKNTLNLGRFGIL